MPALSKEEIYRLIDEYQTEPDGKTVVLFGAGQIGHEAMDYCAREKIEISCIADNNSALWGQKINGITVIPPSELPGLDPWLILLASGRSREMAEQLEQMAVNRHISYYLFQRRYSREDMCPPGATFTERACHWILKNQQASGGVSVFSGSPYEYPEVTGYIVPTMLQYGFQDEALKMAGYLASVAHPDGAFPASGSDQVFLFDTAQALRGLNAIGKITNAYDGLREKTAEYLFSVLENNGGIFPDSYRDDPIIPESIMLFALPAMLEYAQAVGNDRKVSLVHQAVKAYLQSPQTLSLKTLTHFLAYQIDGLIDMGYAGEVQPVIRQLLASQREDGSIPAYEGVDWVCITGCSQIAICLYKLGQPAPADRLMAWVEQHMEDDGGFLGSVGAGAYYFEDRELSWAVKFYLDAYKLMIRAHFDYQFAAVAPDKIPADDDEVTAVINELQGCEHILEIGCGKGRILKRVHERFPDCSLEGADISPEMLSYVPEYVKTSVADMEFLPFETGKFDLVYTVECIEHSVNLRAAVRELLRVCKPGGKVIVIDKQQSSWGRLATPPWERWPDRAALEALLGEGCASIQSRPVHPAGGDLRDDMFILWQGIKQ